MHSMCFAPGKIERHIYDRQPEKFPDWVTESEKPYVSLRDLNELIVNMHVRGLAHEYIAKWCECPVGYVHAIRRIRSEVIDEMRLDLEFCKEAAKRSRKHLAESLENLTDDQMAAIMRALAGR